MTLPAPSDDTSSILAAPAIGVTAPTAVEALWQRQGTGDPRGLASRILGRTPVAKDARAWFAPALGEVLVAERLRTLSTSGETWRVVHAIPALPGEPEVDHLVIGPGGVVALSTASRDERPPDVAARRPEAEAARTSELLSRALGRHVVVRSIVIAVDPARRPAAATGTDVVGVDRMVRHLSALPPVLSVDEVREITRTALHPRTWRSALVVATQGAGSGAHPTASELGFWFAKLRTEVQRARRVRIAWVTSVGGVLVAAAAIAPMVVQQLPS
ncbi:nuclease-related domain-containing protein [Frondihabitans sp. PAMC 28766]|uniref:nuclease-related domain-containing protein n=1 Tax=Frondihabitans sp. PAMC 28766 TaxID=1795630 RepID=UPI0012FF8D27|nr:nuclease-related domain-containing protein [Frondihabitans sp. PAMC 28766]